MESTNHAPPPQQNAGSTSYTSLALYLYDFWVLWLSNSFAWKCPTSTIQLPTYRSALGKCHLEVGVGTGYYPVHGLAGSGCQEITLADLNPTTLESSKRRIEKAHGAKVKVNTLLADASQPLPLPDSQKFDSISLYFLLHCMPGPPEQKNRVFRVMAQHLAEDGVLVGSTILGREAEMNWFAERLMTVYNRKGIFDNWDDSRAGFEKGLKAEFEEVFVWVVGRVMMFTAKRPRK
ncbi:Fc.00g011560.m01.CDS01 [Cosmosporella sp. VM-42]